MNRVGVAGLGVFLGLILTGYAIGEIIAMKNTFFLVVLPFSVLGTVIMFKVLRDEIHSSASVSERHES